MRARLLVLLLLVAAPPADAQIGRLLDRAREAASGARDQAQTAVQRTTRTGPAPALDFGSLLDTVFIPGRSEFRLGEPRGYSLLFPNEGFDANDIDGRYQLRDAGGSVAWRSDIRGAETTGSDAVVLLRGGGATATVASAGSYTLEVVYDGETVGALPFTATVQASGDPFAPGSATRVDGPWRTHGYFQHEVERPDEALVFHTWLRRDEPEAQHVSEVSIRRGGREVAWGTGSANGTTDGWVRAEYRLYTPDGRDTEFARRRANAVGWTVQDVTPGAYEIVLSSADGPFRTLSVQGADGAFVPHARSALDTSPRTHYLTPRRMGGQMRNKPQQLDWVGPETL